MHMEVNRHAALGRVFEAFAVAPSASTDQAPYVPTCQLRRAAHRALGRPAPQHLIEEVLLQLEQHANETMNRAAFETFCARCEIDFHSRSDVMPATPTTSPQLPPGPPPEIGAVVRALFRGRPSMSVDEFVAAIQQQSSAPALTSQLTKPRTPSLLANDDVTTINQAPMAAAQPLSAMEIQHVLQGLGCMATAAGRNPSAADAAEERSKGKPLPCRDIYPKDLEVYLARGAAPNLAPIEFRSLSTSLPAERALVVSENEAGPLDDRARATVTTGGTNPSDLHSSIAISDLSEVAPAVSSPTAAAGATQPDDSVKHSTMSLAVKKSPQIHPSGPAMQQRASLKDEPHKQPKTDKSSTKTCCTVM